MTEHRLIIDMQSDHERDVLFKAATLALDPFGLITALSFREPIDMDAEPDYEYPLECVPPNRKPWVGITIV